MFGFLRPVRPSTTYRQAYARVCMHQHLHFGASSLPWLSYEAVLVYVAACDVGAIPAPAEDAPRCCRLRTNRRLADEPDAGFGAFCAAVGLTLTAIKLEDDVRDSGSWLARAVRWKYQTHFATARRWLTNLDPHFPDRVHGFIADHLRLEQAEAAVDLETYVQPTAEAFGYVFGLAAALPRPGEHRPNKNSKELDHPAFFTHLGRNVGAALIAHDCAVDWKRDRRTGQYNPLPHESAVRDALRFRRRRLLDAARDVEEVAGRQATAGELLKAKAERTPALNLVEGSKQAWNGFTAWDFLRQRKHVYAGDCGGCDCSGCDCSGCDCSGCEGCDSCNVCGAWENLNCHPCGDDACGNPQGNKCHVDCGACDCCDPGCGSMCDSTGTKKNAGGLKKSKRDSPGEPMSPEVMEPD